LSRSFRVPKPVKILADGGEIAPALMVARNSPPGRAGAFRHGEGWRGPPVTGTDLNAGLLDGS
jgi:hypothetical protein